MQTLTSRSTSRRRWARFLGTGATVLVAATAIGSAAGAAPTSTPANAPGFANGSVAALQASSMEVQNTSTGQTTVSWTSTTQFSKTVSESVSSLAAGDCVTVTGTPSKSSKTTIAARSITLLTPSSTGSCTNRGTAGGTSTGGAGFGGAGGFNFRRGGAGGTSGTRPSFPAGSARRFAGAGSIAIASGKVTGVSGSTVSVSGIDISPGSFAGGKAASSKSSKSSKSAKPVTPKTQNLKITTSGSTTLSSTQSAASTDLAVGDCVTAVGPSATNGAVTATTVRITSTGGATCTSGFGGGGGGFFGGGGGGGGGFGGAAPGGGSA
ncbi:MAG: DUF5666 domain-containing protein [Acidimicrobiales bacterium]